MKYAAVKRFCDALLATLGIFCFLPLGALIAFAIYIAEGRPVLFIQERVGRKGVIFEVFKFRTMGYHDPQSLLARCLRRTALDELPQLVNIARGDMSFVGPRPLIPAEVCGDTQLELRGKVRPGLTGVAQLNATKDTPVLEKLRYDLWYIDHCSLWLDMSLVLQSCWVSARSRWDALKPKPL